MSSLNEFEKEVLEHLVAHGAEFAVGFALGKLHGLVEIERMKVIPKVEPPKDGNGKTMHYPNKEARKEAERQKKKNEMLSRKRWTVGDKRGILTLVQDRLLEYESLSTKDLVGLVGIEIELYSRFWGLLQNYQKDGHVKSYKLGRVMYWYHPEKEIPKAHREPVKEIVVNA